MLELERASVALDELAEQMVERWLHLAAGVAVRREAMHAWALRDDESTPSTSWTADVRTVTSGDTNSFETHGKEA